MSTLINKLTAINLLTLLVISLMSVQTNGQDAEKDFRKINKAYLNKKELVLNISYNLYASESGLQPAHSYEGKLLKKGERLYSKMGNSETIRNKGMQLTIDHDNKLMMLTPFDKGEKDKSTLFMNMEEVLKLCDNISYRILDGRKAVYTLSTLLTGSYGKIEVFFDTESFLIHRMVLFYREEVKLNEESQETGKPRLEIEYKNAGAISATDESMLSYSKYLHHSKDGYSLKEPYLNYELYTNQ